MYSNRLRHVTHSYSLTRSGCALFFKRVASVVTHIFLLRHVSSDHPEWMSFGTEDPRIQTCSVNIRKR
jgi:hypothetical protein